MRASFSHVVWVQQGTIVDLRRALSAATGIAARRFAIAGAMHVVGGGVGVGMALEGWVGAM